MPYVMIDCGGFKRIMPTDKPNSIRKIQDDFRQSTIEGDANGHARLYSDDDIIKMFGGVSNSEMTDDVISVNVKSTRR